MSFLRFVAFEPRRPDGASSGPFGLAYALARDDDQPDYYRQALREHMDWFGTHLPVPERFCRRLGRTSMGYGVCWFRAGAGEHISRMRDMCLVLDEIGHPSTPWRATRPSPFLYQDEVQVVALETTRPTRASR